MKEVVKILKMNDIRSTECREGVLEYFIRRDHALSQPDLEKALGEDFDRVTIYRTLTLFLEKGLVHKVLDDSGAMKYALCASGCEEHFHQHDHVHFKCNICEKTICIEDIQIPEFKLPKGYKVEERNILLSGICSGCSGS